MLQGWGIARVLPYPIRKKEIPRSMEREISINKESPPIDGDLLFAL